MQSIQTADRLVNRKFPCRRVRPAPNPSARYHYPSAHDADHRLQDLVEQAQEVRPQRLVSPGTPRLDAEDRIPDWAGFDLSCQAHQKKPYFLGNCTSIFYDAPSNLITSMNTPRPPARRIIELRKHPRIFTPSGALFSFKRLIIPTQSDVGAEGEGTLIDLSLGGCRLTSDVPLEIGEQYRLILQVSSQSRPIPVEAAVVRWMQDKTYGLKFTALQSNDEARLQELLLEIRHLAV